MSPTGIFDEFITQSPKARHILDVLKRSAATNATILLMGETGVGKDHVARLVHRASPRREGPFVAVNCAAIPDTLAESELFGHEKGAFTDAKNQRIGRFEQAHGGTIFLNEIGEMSPAAQAKLLRSLEDRVVDRVGGMNPVPVDVRVLAATNRELEAAVSEGKFREDLYYRLNEITVVLPPLRERPEDIPLLCEHFVREMNAELGRGVKGLSRTAMTFLSRYPFKGNVRELRTMIKRAMILCDSDIIWLEHLPISIGIGTSHLHEEPDPSQFATLAEIERRHILKALEITGQNKSKAAELLGIDRSTLYARLRGLKLAGEGAANGSVEPAQAAKAGGPG
ncbi:MAG: sigma-54-dependent Fis family transcriptional regulator [Nitrospirae bacterium]|nr:sigma-54-dependent Fis family transcriptional regulator [Nitrospirota bacterium]